MSLLPRLRRRPEGVLVLAALLVVLGAMLRFYALDGRGLWLDEVSTTDALSLPSPSAVALWCRSFLQGPLFFVSDWASAAALGQSESAIRLPSAIAGAVSVYYAYHLGRALFGPVVGLLTAVVLATGFFPVWYAQEARPYAFVILLSAAQLFYAYQAVRLSRARDWVALALATTLALYNHYLALAPTLACSLFVGVGLAQAAWRARRHRDPATRRRFLVLAVAAVDAAVLALLLYIPWLRSMVLFLRGDRNSGYLLAMYAGHHFSPGDVFWMLDTFGFQGFLLLLLAVGVVGAVLAWRWGSALAVTLLAMAIAVPLGVLALKAHGAVFVVWARYLSFLYPPLAVLAALGGQTLAEAVAAAVGRWRPGSGPRTLTLAAVAVAAAMAAQALSLTLPGYAYQKDDYRGAMDYVLAHGSAADVVIPSGYLSIWAAEGLPYYSRLRKADVLVADADLLNGYEEFRPRLHQPGVTVWLAVINGDDPHGLRAHSFLANADRFDDLAQYPSPGLRMIRFQGVTLVRVTDSGLTPVDQAITMLQWAAEFDPPLRPQLKSLIAAERPTAG